MKEYDRLDAAYFDYYSTGVQGDTNFYVEEAKKAGSPVLEIGCGTGRILIPVAEAGINIVGLDRAPAMLDIARKKIEKLNPETQHRITLVEDDMRDFSLNRRFNLITIPYRAFLHMLTPEDQRKALTCIREHLADNGLLIFNFFDPRLDFIMGNSGPLSSALKKESEFMNPETGDKVVFWNALQYDFQQQKVNVCTIFDELDSDGKVIGRSYNFLTLRYIYRYEMQYLLELCGYEIVALYGDFKRGDFKYGGEQIWIARKK